MALIATDNTIIWTLVGLAVVLALIAGWRVIVHDRSISRIRFGIFWERERSADLEHVPRHEERDRWEKGPEFPRREEKTDE